MSHVNAKRSTAGTPRVWLEPSRQMIRKVSDIAGWVVVKMGPEMAKESGTAEYITGEEEIEINSTKLFPGVKPENFKVGDVLWELKNAAGMGAFYHEAAHAAFSTWSPKEAMSWKDFSGVGIAPRELDVMLVLEESRVEALFLNAQASQQIAKMMSTMSMEIVLKDFELADDLYGASIGAALSVARVDAGSLSQTSADVFLVELSKRISEELMAEFRNLWLEYQSITSRKDSAGRPVYIFPYTKARDIARRWIELVKENDPEDQDGDGEGEGEEGDKNENLASAAAKAAAGEGGEDGEDSEGESEGDGEDSDDRDDSLKDGLAKAARQAGLEEEMENIEESQEVKKQQAMEEKKVLATREQQNKVAHGKTYSFDEDANLFQQVRKPEADERSAANEFAKKLAKVTAVSITSIKTNQDLPPGRLIGAQAVQGAAQLRRGAQYTARPFNAVRNVRTENDKIRIAILADTSGSMASAMEPSGIMTYVLSRGSQVADAKTTTILFGEQAHAISRPGVKVENVMIPHSMSGWENFEPAARAADKELDLLNGDGARMVIILSDGYFVDGRAAKFADTWMRLAEKAGVSVLWVHWREVDNTHGYGETLEFDRWNRPTPVQAARQIGDKVIELVKKNHKTI